MVTFWSSWALCADLRETSAQHTTTRHFILSVSSLLQSQDSLNHNMARIIQISLDIFIWSIWPQMVVEHNWRSNWTDSFTELGDVPLGGRCGETMELEGREPTINTTLTSRDIQTESMRQSGSGARSVEIGWEDVILPGIDDPLNCVNPHPGQSDWDQKLGKIECVFSLYDKMTWKWDDVCQLRGVPNIYSPSLYPPPLPLYIRTPAITPSRCTWMLWWSEFPDALGGRGGANLEVVIVSIWRFTWRPRLSELRDALRDRDQASSEIHMEAKIMWTCGP